MKTKIIDFIKKTKRWAFSSRKTQLASLGVALVLVLLVSTSIALVMERNKDQNVVVSGKVAQIEITPEGFRPSTILVEKGTQIIWTNTEEGLHQIASNPHPSHDSKSDLYSEILNNQQSYEYIVKDSGVIEYHDELNPTLNGTVQIKE